MRSFFLLLILFVIGSSIYAQDSTIVDTINSVIDTQAVQHTVTSTANTPRNLGNVRKGSSGMTPFFLGLGAFLLFGLLRFVYAKHLDALVGVLSKSTLGRMTSKDSLWRDFMPRVLFIFLYFVCCGFIIGKFIAHFSSMKEPAITFWLWGVIIMVGLSILKRLSIHAVALVFRFTKTAKSFFNHRSVVNQVLGFILLPICGAILLAPNKFGTILLFIGGFIFVISLIFRLLINVAYVRNLSRVSFFHFIIYLCTLEIIPMAVCARYVYNSIGA